MEPANIYRALERIDDYWSPKVVGAANDHYVKVAKLKGALVWHEHANSDELFLILKGRLRIELEDRTVDLRQGDVFTVPRGVRHNPVADEECWILLVEQKETLHTGGIEIEGSRSIEEQLA